MRDGKLNTLGYFMFSGWSVSGHEFRIPEFFKCLKYWKTYNFTLRWLVDLSNTSLEQNLRLKTLGYLLFIPAIYFFICCLAASCPTFGCYRANSLTHPMLITAFIFYILYLYIKYNSLAEKSLMLVWFMLWLQRNWLIYYTVLRQQVLFIRGSKN